MDGGPLAAELVPFLDVCDKAAYVEEGGRRYVFMENLRFYERGQERVLNALLCLNYPNPVYPTKLYFSAILGTPGLNWNEHASIVARSWHTWSWKDVPPGRPPIEILADHLRAFA